jgi:hypothetical protein
MGMTRMEGMVAVDDCGNDEEPIVDAEHQRKKSIVGSKRIAGSIPYEKICFGVLGPAYSRPVLLFI